MWKAAKVSFPPEKLGARGVSKGGVGRPRGRSAGSRTEARPSYDDLCQSSRLRKRVPLCRHPCRYRTIRLTWMRCPSPTHPRHHNQAPHTTPRSRYVHCSTCPSNEKSHCHPYLSSLLFPSLSRPLEQDPCQAMGVVLATSSFIICRIACILSTHQAPPLSLTIRDTSWIMFLSSCLSSI